MVQGIKFLTKKGFNPHNLTNRKRVWEAEQQEAAAQTAAAERAATLQRERDDAAILQARGMTPRVGFLYDRPPGLPKEKQKKETKDPLLSPMATTNASAATDTASFTTVRPDDDPATAAFRQLLAAGKPNQEEPDTTTVDNERAELQSHFTGGVLQGRFVPRTTDDEDDTAAKAAAHKQKMKAKPSLSALEQAVGRRKGSAATTLDEQIERFPALANAPRATKAPTTNMTFQPLGCQIRNVQCLRCGQWGHSVGDRECAVTGWNPFAAVAGTNDAARSHKGTSAREGSAAAAIDAKVRAREDPMVSAKASGDMEDRERRHRRKRSSSVDSERRKKRKKKKKRKHRRRYDSDSSEEDAHDRKRHRKERRR